MKSSISNLEVKLIKAYYRSVLLVYTRASIKLRICSFIIKEFSSKYHDSFILISITNHLKNTNNCSKECVVVCNKILKYSKLANELYNEVNNIKELEYIN